MEETIFEMMERTRFVDRLLPTLALFVPILVFVALKIFRTSDLIRRLRPELILTAVSIPVIWILWRIYNAVADHYGVASIAGIFVNAAIFMIVSAALWSFYYMVLLRHAPDGEPQEESADTSAAAQEPVENLPPENA